MARYEESDADVVRSFQHYRRVKGLPAGPQEGQTPCPACKGDGCFVKKLPLLGVKAARVCKTCGGAGYIGKQDGKR